MGLVSELRRRNVHRMAALYLAAAWLVMQVVDVVENQLALPDWIGGAVLAVLVVGFPIALIISWFFEVTLEGISAEKDLAPGESASRVASQRLSFVVISLLCAGLILFAYDKWWTGPPAEASIAVLPFENMSADPDQGYFADGIAEEVLNLLAQIPELTVISRSSAFSFRDQNLTITEIARQLNVAHVLEGSVRRAGNRVRVTAQLIEARSDSHLWSETYDRELDDIFSVEDEIAGAIGQALRLKFRLVAGEATPPTAIKTSSTAAYDAYLLGRELLSRRDKDAIEHLERSLRLDDNFAPAHALLAIAMTQGWNPVFSAMSLEDVRRRTLPHLDRAQQLEPELAEAHGGRALLALKANDPEAAIGHARKALQSNPSYVDAMNWMNVALYDIGRYQEADAGLTQVLAVDPMNIVARQHYIEVLAETGRYEEAHDLADQLHAQYPTRAYFWHAMTSVEEGNTADVLSWGLKANPRSVAVFFPFSWVREYDEARRVNEELQFFIDMEQGHFDAALSNLRKAMDPDDEEFLALNANILYDAGRIDEARPFLERALELSPVGRPIIGSLAHVRTLWLVQARRQAGDEDGAQAVAEIVRQDLVARRTSGRTSRYQYWAEAMLAAFDDDPERALVKLKSAIDHGLRYWRTFENPIFAGLWSDPRFIALQQEMEILIAADHEEVLQLICFNNPVPDNWRPLPQTCAGAVKE